MEPLIGYYMHPPSPRHHLEDSIMNSIVKAQFQQKQMQEKEHKLLQMLDSQQQMALQKAGLNGVLPSKYSNNAYNNAINSGTATPNSFPPGKVRQMFEERRKGGGTLTSNNLYNSNSATNGNTTPGGSYRNGGIIGIDKSYPLDPILAPKRSSSSKSDPNPNSYAVRNTHRSINKVASVPVVPSRNRGISLDRKQQQQQQQQHPRSSSRDGRESSFSTNGAPPVGAYRRANSGLSRSSYDDELTLRPNNIGSTTTKYADIYGNNNKSPSPEAIAHRESVLAAKMRGLEVTESGRGGGLSAEVSKPPKAPLRSKSPIKKAPVAPARSKTSTINNGAAGSRAGAAAASKQSLSRTTSDKTPPPPRGPPPPGLEECKICGRYFAPDRIAKHETICKKTTTKKRKVFDPTIMRMQGTDAEPYIRQVSAKASRPSQKAPGAGGKKKADWRKKHEEFIRTIRAAKEYQAHVAAGGNPADLPPPPPSDNSDYVQCPHCGRKFSEGVADRHIPKCKNIKSNKR